MLRPLSIVLAASAALFGATAAHAETHWSIGINLPVPGVVVSNGGYYVQDQTPVYYAPAPVVRYAPVYDAPRVYAPPPVVYQEPEPVYQVPYRGWQGGRDSSWERRREFEHARWEQARRDPHGNWDRRDEGRHDDGDSRRWHRD